MACVVLGLGVRGGVAAHLCVEAKMVVVTAFVATLAAQATFVGSLGRGRGVSQVQILLYNTYISVADYLGNMLLWTTTRETMNFAEKVE